MAFGVPVKLIVAEDPLQTAEVLVEKDAVAELLTMIVTAVFLILEHVLKSGEVQLTNVYVLFEVTFGIVMLAKPDAFKFIV